MQGKLYRHPNSCITNQPQSIINSPSSNFHIRIVQEDFRNASLTPTDKGNILTYSSLNYMFMDNKESHLLFLILQLIGKTPMCTQPAYNDNSIDDESMEHLQRQYITDNKTDSEQNYYHSA